MKEHKIPFYNRLMCVISMGLAVGFALQDNVSLTIVAVAVSFHWIFDV